MSVWFITGAARGFGQELASAALADGDQVVATGRDLESVRAAFPEDSEALLPVRLDVTDAGQAEAAVASATDAFGRIDVLVNNAGYGLFGAVEEVSDPEVRQLFDANVFGLLNVTRAVLPVMRGRGRGHVLNMGSSAGFRAGAGRGLYGASKFAVEALSEAMHDELKPLGIHVTVVEPGSFRTGFLSSQSVRKPGATLPAYESTAGVLLAALATNDGKQAGDPERAARAIRTLVAADDPPLRLPLGSDSVALVEGKLDDVAKALAQWRMLSLSTDFDEDAT